ncbi:MAG: glycosyltransferase [Spartobacteria bacterium]|nr:glycosyltransferase [Spartobacteria bacterium]
MPKVSIIIPNFNYARYLRQRIESVLRQDFTDVEIILLDDASTDGSRSIIEAYRQHPAVRHIFLNEHNSGSPFRQWNQGVAAATGDYIWIAEADDYAAPTLLSRLAAVLDANPNVGLAYCQSYMVNDWKKRPPTARQYTDDLDTERWKTDYINDGPSECVRYLLYKNTIPNASAVLFRKDIYQRVGQAPEDMAYMGDWMTWIHMLAISDIAFISEPLNYFRFHGRSVRHTNHFRPRFYYERFQVLRFLKTTFPVPAPDFQLVRDLVLDDWFEQILGIGGQSGWEDTKATWRLAREVDPMVTARLLSRGVALLIQRVFKQPLTAPDDDKRALLKGLFIRYAQSLWRWLGQTGAHGAPPRVALCGAPEDLRQFLSMMDGMVPAPDVAGLISDSRRPIGAFTPAPPADFDVRNADVLLLVSRKEDDHTTRLCHEQFSGNIRTIELFRNVPDVPLV